MKWPLLLASVVLALSCGTPPAAAPPATRAAAPAPPASDPLPFAAIDAMLAAKWEKENTKPAPVCDDATFLRRVTIDLVGRTPAPDDIRRFLADNAPEKRRRAVEALLESPAYATHWTNYWDDVLMGREVRSNLVDRMAFRAWLRARFRENAPWDTMTTRLVAAVGVNSLGGPRTKGPMAMPVAELSQEEETAEDPAVNGAVNYALRFSDAPQDLAGSESRTFLGVQLQCAQCHDHKTESWKQSDFRSFAAAALHVAVVLDKDDAMGGIKRATVQDSARVLPRVRQNADASPIANAKSRALDGTDLEKKEETRRALAAWMTSRENPYFARAFVNRMWGHFLGRGFSDPVDDMRPSNAPEAPEILDLLAKDFASHGFDVKRLLKTITAVRAYHLSSDAAAQTGPDNRLWAKFRLVPLGPEELLNALFAATGIEEAARAARVDNLPQLRAQVVKQFSFLFDVDEEIDARDFSGTVTQALTLMNGNLVGFGARAIPGSTLARTLASTEDDGARIEAIFLRVLSRPPREEERARWVAYVRGAVAPAPSTLGRPPPAPRGKGARDGFARFGAAKKPADAKTAAYEDLMWALLNSTELMFNH